jgi:DNA-binding transcriptional regulator YbjK
MVRMTTTAAPGSTPAPSGRRAELLAAGVRVLAAAGLRGLTHRAVDAEAGLPEGTCSAYLRTRSALLTALAEHVGGRLAGDVDTMATRLRDHRAPGAPCGAEPVGPVVDAVTELFLGWLEEPEVVRAQAELALEAARDPDLMSVFDRWRRGMLGVVEGVADHAGADPAPHRAAVAVAALEGVLVTAARMPEGDRAAFVEDAVPALVRALHAAT